MCAIYTGIPGNFRAPCLETPVDCLRSCLGEIEEFLGSPWEELGRSLGAFFDGCSGEFLGRLWKVKGWFLATSWVHYRATALGQTLAQLCKFSGGIDKILGDSLGKFAKPSGCIDQLLEAFCCCLGGCSG